MSAALIERLVARGAIRTNEVRRAFESVDRHAYVPEVSPEDAWADRPLHLEGPGEAWTSSVSQPSAIAIMLEQAGVLPGHQVLEIGTASGYNAALLAHLVGPTGHVDSMEVLPHLAARARAALARNGATNVTVHSGDGGRGIPDSAFDRIVVTASVATPTPAWFDQLHDGGRLVLPLSLRGFQACGAFERRGRRLQGRGLQPCSFVPLKGETVGVLEVGPLEFPEHSVTIECSSPDLVSDGSELPVWFAALRVQALGLRLGVRELHGGLIPWLFLHAPNVCRFSGEGLPVALARGAGGERWTIGLVTDSGLAVLEGDLDEASTSLRVRSGGDPAPGNQLVALIRDWQEHGEPIVVLLAVEGVHHEDTDPVLPSLARYRADPWTFHFRRPETSIVARGSTAPSNKP